MSRSGTDRRKSQSRVVAAAPVEPTEATAAVPSRFDRLGLWVGTLLCAAAFPPLNFDWAILPGLVPWLDLIARPTLPGRRPWVRMYLAALLWNLLVLHWLRHPHPGASAGGLALSAYLAVYGPLWVALARTGTHRCGWPLVATAPLAFVACEWLRGTLLTGFSMAQLGHVVYLRPLLVQTADLGGPYLVGALIVVAAVVLRGGLERIVHGLPRQVSGGSLAGGMAVLVAALGYGLFRLSETPPADAKTVRIALLQGTVRESLGMTDAERRAILPQYDRLALAAAADRPDLIVWPEAILRHPYQWLVPEPAAAWNDFAARAAGKEPKYPREEVLREHARSRNFLRDLAQAYGRPTLLGIGITEVGPDRFRSYNGSVLVDPERGVVGEYRKTGLVMFGEYVPFAERFPILYDWLPLPGSLASGPAGQPPFEVAGLRILPNICFESTSPQGIGGQVRTAIAAGVSPDLLLNQTNDGWFAMSSELELHAACAVFRAVENRRPFVMAANSGLSGAVDPWGRLTDLAPRGAETHRTVTVRPQAGSTWYLMLGDAFALTCLALSVGWCLPWPRRKGSNASSSGEIG